MAGLNRRFRLTKWYLDCTAEDGRTAIAYWIGVSWPGLDFAWHGIDLYGVHGEHSDRWSVERAPPPAVTDGGLVWHAPAIGSSLRMQARGPALRVPLLPSEAAASPGSRDDGPELDWHCEVPGGPAEIELTGLGTLQGPGYAECLTLTRPPWQLPLDSLRWGRWIRLDGGRSLVWIDWQGPAPRTWVFLDGRAVGSASVSDDGARGPGFDLVLTRERTLVHRDLAERLGTVPGLTPLVPGWFRTLRDTKWRGTGTLTESGCPPVTGPALFETVRLR